MEWNVSLQFPVNRVGYDGLSSGYEFLEIVGYRSCRTNAERLSSLDIITSPLLSGIYTYYMCLCLTPETAGDVNHSRAPNGPKRSMMWTQ